MEAISTRKVVSAYTLRYEKSSELHDVELPQTTVGNPRDMAEMILKVYDASGCCIVAKEYAFAIMMDRSLSPLGYIKVSEGGVTCTTIDARLIVKAALDLSATAVVLCHNHPSASPLPSQADIKQTEKLKKALDTFDIWLADHIIISRDKCYSFSEEKTFSIAQK